MNEKELSCNYPILVAEDNPVSQNLVERILMRAGHEVVSVENGREALELLNERFFPIVITDWMMPEMTGLELCRAIRRRDSPGYVFILIVTARDAKDDIVAGLEAGADDYLTKPIHGAELIARLKTCVRILELERSLNKANEEIKTLSITDPLTGCYNRGYLADRFPQELSRARAYKHSLSVVLCDLDHFKKVNDTYGHQAGDEVLKEVVLRIKASVRDNVDWVVRYGGEEFLIVLPETDSMGAYRTAERLKDIL